MNIKEKLDEIKKLVNEIESSEIELNYYQIPGIKLESDLYDHHLVKNIPDPNKKLFQATKHQIKEFINFINSDIVSPNEMMSPFENEKLDELIKNYFDLNNEDLKISTYYENLYANFEKSSPAENIINQPIIGALSDGKNIYTNIYFFENYNVQMTKNNFKIYQNYTIGADGLPQLSYYICFKITQKKKGDTYRMHKFSIKNMDMKTNVVITKEGKYEGEPLNINTIKNVMAFVVDVDPEASRGTVTTVKSTSTN